MAEQVMDENRARGEWKFTRHTRDADGVRRSLAEIEALRPGLPDELYANRNSPSPTGGNSWVAWRLAKEAAIWGAASNRLTDDAIASAISVGSVQPTMLEEGYRLFKTDPLSFTTP
jgi:hypothetical protein